MRALAAGVALLLALAGCGRDDPSSGTRTGDPGAPLEVLVVNYPLQYFAERIGGGHVRVAFPVPGGVDPAYWSPAPEAVVGFQQADVILLNGAGYARWVERATLPASRLVVTAAAAADRFIDIEGGITHSHGPGPAHSHAGTASLTWLDPAIAILQARAVRDALVRARPRLEEELSVRFDALHNDLLLLDETFERVAKSRAQARLVASHPVYHYFARRYAFEIRSVHWDPEKAQDDVQWSELDEILRTHAATAMLWEAKPLQETADALARRGIAVAVFETCGASPESGDYLAVMKRNAAALQAALRR